MQQVARATIAFQPKRAGERSSWREALENTRPLAGDVAGLRTLRPDPAAQHLTQLIRLGPDRQQVASVCDASMQRGCSSGCRAAGGRGVMLRVRRHDRARQRVCSRHSQAPDSWCCGACLHEEPAVASCHILHSTGFRAAARGGQSQTPHLCLALFRKCVIWKLENSSGRPCRSVKPCRFSFCIRSRICRASLNTSQAALLELRHRADDASVKVHRWQ